MTLDEKTIWNKKHGEHTHSSLTPDPLLVSAHDEFLSEQPAGKALDVAGGVGRHAIWLAERGWQVRLLDISEVAMEQTKENMKTVQPGLISTEVVDLSTGQNLGHEQYDLIMVFFFLQRDLFPAFMAALKPGGYLVYKTYTTEQRRFAGGPSHPMFLLERNELLHAFQSLRILHYHETIRQKGVAELVAQKHFGK